MLCLLRRSAPFFTVKGQVSSSTINLPTQYQPIGNGQAEVLPYNTPSQFSKDANTANHNTFVRVRYMHEVSGMTAPHPQFPMYVVCVRALISEPMAETMTPPPSKLSVMIHALSRSLRTIYRLQQIRIPAAPQPQLEIVRPVTHAFQPPDMPLT